LVPTHARDLPLQPRKRPPALKRLGGIQGGELGDQLGSELGFSRSESAQLPKEKI